MILYFFLVIFPVVVSILLPEMVESIEVDLAPALMELAKTKLSSSLSIVPFFLLIKGTSSLARCLELSSVALNV